MRWKRRARRVLVEGLGWVGSGNTEMYDTININTMVKKDNYYEK